MTVARTLHPRSALGPDLPEVPFDHPLRAEFSDWLRHNGPEGEDPLEQDAKFSHRREWQRALAAGGWGGVGWPVEYGGRGAGPLEKFMIYEEMALGCVPEPTNTPGILLLGPTLMAIGTPELCDRFLRPILQADEIWAQCFSEPDSGSDLASLRTKARLDGSGDRAEWVIDGSKTWSTFAQYADLLFVLCRTDPASEKHRGLSLLICPVDQPGVTIRPIAQISGDAEFCEVFFDGARTPASWVVGEVNQGWAASMVLLAFERADQGFTDHARILVALHEARQPAEGLDPADRAAMRRRWALLWARGQELRQLNQRMALMESAGVDCGSLGSVTNLIWAELYKDVHEFCAERAGGSAVVAAHSRLPHHRLHARATSIYSGTSEIQRNVISERLVGLPR